MHCQKILLVTADDFGYDCDRNRGILECFEKYAITRASVLVNGVARSEAFALADLHNIPLGLHINLSEGVPVSSVQAVGSLLSADKVFLGKAGIRNALENGILNMEEVEVEICAQVEAFRLHANGKLPEYADGHQHVHILPVEKSQDRFQPLGELGSALGYFLSSSSLNGVHIEAMRIGNRTQAFERFTHGFIGLTTIGIHMTTERLCSRISHVFETAQRKLDEHQTTITCELMVHPGYRCRGFGGCGSGPDDFACSNEREHELDILNSDELKEFYLKQHFKLHPMLRESHCKTI